MTWKKVFNRGTRAIDDARDIANEKYAEIYGDAASETLAEYRNNEIAKQANEESVKVRDQLLQDIVDQSKAAVDYPITGRCGQANVRPIFTSESIQHPREAPFKPGQWDPVKDIKDIPQHEPGAKLDGGKPDAGLLLDFGASLIAVAEVGTFGANKYSRGGWKSVPQAEERYTAALVRHLLAEEAGEIDDETGLTHASAVAWNALARLKFILERRSKSNGSHKVSRVNNAIKERAGQESYSFGERIKRSENLNGQAK